MKAEKWEPLKRNLEKEREYDRLYAEAQVEVATMEYEFPKWTAPPPEPNNT